MTSAQALRVLGSADLLIWLEFFPGWMRPMEVVVVVLALLIVFVPAYGVLWGISGALGAALLIGFFFLVFGVRRPDRVRPDR